MNHVFAIARRELGAYFDAPLAYFAVTIYVILVGAFALWFDDMFDAGAASLRSLFFWAGIFLVLLTPAVTMRLFAEERRVGSIELLLTLPVTEGELVLGKYLAALGLVSTAVLATGTYAITLLILGTPPGEGVALIRALTESSLEPGPTLCGYLGLLLLGAALTAIGLACSSLTSNQVVAFLLALALSIFPFAVGFFLEQVPLESLALVQYLSFDYHRNNLARGVLDTRNLVFFGSVIGVALHVAVAALERERLR